MPYLKDFVVTLVIVALLAMSAPIFFERFRPPPPIIIKEPFTITMQHPNVVVIDHGKCWTSINVKKRTTFHSCADEGTP